MGEPCPTHPKAWHSVSDTGGDSGKWVPSLLGLIPAFIESCSKPPPHLGEEGNRRSRESQEWGPDWRWKQVWDTDCTKSASRAAAITRDLPWGTFEGGIPIVPHPCPLAGSSCSLVSHLIFPKLSSPGAPGYKTSLRTYFSQVQLPNSSVCKRYCSACWLEKLGQPYQVRGSRSCDLFLFPYGSPQLTNTCLAHSAK